MAFDEVFINNCNRMFSLRVILCSFDSCVRNKRKIADCRVNDRNFPTVCQGDSIGDNLTYTFSVTFFIDNTVNQYRVSINSSRVYIPFCISKLFSNLCANLVCNHIALLRGKVMRFSDGNLGFNLRENTRIFQRCRIVRASGSAVPDFVILRHVEVIQHVREVLLEKFGFKTLLLYYFFIEQAVFNTVYHTFKEYNLFYTAIIIINRSQTIGTIFNASTDVCKGGVMRKLGLFFVSARITCSRNCFNARENRNLTVNKILDTLLKFRKFPIMGLVIICYRCSGNKFSIFGTQLLLFLHVFFHLV